MARIIYITVVFSENLTEQERERMARIAARDNREVPGYVTVHENGFMLTTDTGSSYGCDHEELIRQSQAQADGDVYANMLVESFKRSIGYTVSLRDG